MILRPGRWAGRGSYVRHGQSLTTRVECTFEISTEGSGFNIQGAQTLADSESEHGFSIWITANEVGTYDIDARYADWELAGTAKLESVPNLGMLWSADRLTQVAFALFDANNGTGLRGFGRAGDDLVTWEIVIQELQRTISGNNVVSLSSRGARRSSRSPGGSSRGPRGQKRR